MITNDNVIDFTSHVPHAVLEEDFIPLLANGDDFIYYVRNYVAAQEFIVVSASIYQKLPEELRPISYVLLLPNFKAIRQFKGEIRKYLLEKQLLRHFYYLFDCSINEFFENIS